VKKPLYVVKENGHPAVTPLEKAVEEKNLDGWKKNEVMKFEANYGENPDEDYEDNVIFPSGTENPLTISDWEWMFEVFAKALDERGWLDSSMAYCTTVEYMDYALQGDLASYFGGGTGYYNVKDGEAGIDVEKMMEQGQGGSGQAASEETASVTTESGQAESAGNGQAASVADFSMVGPRDANRSCGLYETMLSKVAGFTAKGVLWYHCESDVGHCGIYGK